MDCKRPPGRRSLEIAALDDPAPADFDQSSIRHSVEKVPLYVEASRPAGHPDRDLPDHQTETPEQLWLRKNAERFSASKVPCEKSQQPFEERSPAGWREDFLREEVHYGRCPDEYRWRMVCLLPCSPAVPLVEIHRRVSECAGQ